MKRKRRIKKYRSLADLRAWRRSLAFYESPIEIEKAIRNLIDAYKSFMKDDENE